MDNVVDAHDEDINGAQEEAHPHVQSLNTSTRLGTIRMKSRPLPTSRGTTVITRQSTRGIRSKQTIPDSMCPDIQETSTRSKFIAKGKVMFLKFIFLFCFDFFYKFSIHCRMHRSIIR